MSNDRSPKIRILSEYYDEGSRAAERATRRLATMQSQAMQEDLRRESEKAAAIARINAQQAAAMETTGRRMMLAAAAVVAGLALSTKAAMDWESAWAGVRKTVDGSPEEMALLEEQLRSLARSLPATHKEIAAVAEAAGQLGVRRQDVAAFTRTMINLGETTNLSADEAATSIAQFSNIMGISAGEADRLGSSLVALGNNSATTERDILAMSMRVAGAGRSVGMTSDQVLGFSATLASLGIEAEAGGSAISRVMIQIDKDVKAGGSGLEKYAQIAGVSAADFKAAWERDAGGALVLFTEGLGRMQAAGQDTNAAITDLGYTELRTSDALRRLALAGDLTSESLTLSAEAWRENNALTAEAAQRYETAESRMATARNQINDAAIDIGGNFLPVVADAVEWVGHLATGFGSLSPEVQNWVIGLGTAVGGITGLVGAAAVAIPKVVELRTTLDALQGGSSNLGKALGGAATFLTGPWGLALGAAVIAGGLFLHQQGVTRQRVEDLTATLDEQTGAITENTRAKTVSRLEERGALEAAQLLGLELDKVTDAALGNAGAMRYVAAALDEANAAQQVGIEDTTLYTADMARMGEAARILGQAVSGQRDELTQSREEWQRKADALGRAEAASGSAETATDELAAAQTALDAATQASTSALDELEQMLRGLNQPTLDLREAERGWYEQLEQVTEALTANGTSLDITTEKGRANQAVLDGLATAGQRRAAALLEETGNVDAFTASMEESRQALADAAMAYGLSEDAAWEYVDSVLAIPDTIPTQVALDTTAAEQRLAEFRRILSQQTVTITADLRDSNPYYTNRAAGGWGGPGAPTVAAASGLDRPSMIAPGGANILWAEPETGWEAYISGHPKYRQRNIELLGDVASRFGLVVTQAEAIAPRSAVSVPAAAPSLTGLAIEGTLDTPYGPAMLRGVVVDVLQSEADEIRAGRR